MQAYYDGEDEHRIQYLDLEFLHLRPIARSGRANSTSAR